MNARLLVGAIVLLKLGVCLHAGPRDAQWALVEESTGKGLPKTAIEQLGPIIAGALADKDYAEAIKAITEKIELEGKIQGGSPGERILRMQSELGTAPPEMRPVMEAILAHWYWQYYSQNRWRIMQRTHVAGPAGPDFRTWDLNRILSEIDKHLTASLAEDKALKATPISAYNALLGTATVPDSYRPTLYDFVANEALQFYESGELGAVGNEDGFELDADGPIFASATEFISWKPESTDDASPQLKAVRLLQDLLRFHEADADRSAFLDADLGRIIYGNNAAAGEDKAERYRAALGRFVAASSAHEISSRALAAEAAQIYVEGDPARARELAQRGLDAFPASVGGVMCRNIIARIEEKSARLDTERVWNAPWPSLDITYRNVRKVYFRAVSVDFGGYVSRAKWSVGNIGPDEYASALAAKPALEWSADLPATSDYKERTEKLPAPGTLAPGFYFIIASHNPSFQEGDNKVSAVPIWVSDLALVLQTRFYSDTQDGFVLRAGSGEPVAGATLRAWQRGNDDWTPTGDVVTSDKDGRFQFPKLGRTLMILAESGGQSVSCLRESYSYGSYSEPRAGSRTVFFTDRAIYRPGQAISYKGISASYDRDSGDYSAEGASRITVVFYDPNGRELARNEHVTNDYGSFSGVFTAPREGVTGPMRIQVLGDRASGVSVRVEEYKRPKFSVAIDAPAAAAKLAAPVDLTVRATAYTGAPIGGAKVKWRVERGVRAPSWCWWWQPPANKAIAHGVAVTGPEGTYAVRFQADPDPAVPARDEPAFAFTLHADVTDTTGETRSCDRTVTVGYAALQASMEESDWQTQDKPVGLDIRMNSLDGDPQPAEGIVTVYSLKQPSKVERAELSGDRSWRYRGADEPSADPSRPETWEQDKVAGSRSFKADAAGTAQVAMPLAAGIYRALLESHDRFGEKVTARLTVHVIDPGQQRYGVKLPNYISYKNLTVEPGETFTALWGTGYDTGRAFVELESDGKPLKSYWTAPGRTQELIELPISEKMRGGVSMQVTYVRENRAYLERTYVRVPWSNKQLTVKWEHFRSKLTPGEKETWTAVIDGPDGKRAAAEMVASLYDASLDQYARHDWPHAFDLFRHESFLVSSEFENEVQNFITIHDWQSVPTSEPEWQYRALPGIAMISPEDEEPTVLQPFVIDASEDKASYRAVSTLAGTRIRTDLRDVASSVSAVTGQFLRDTGSIDAKGVHAYSAIAGGAGIPDLGGVAARRNLNETAFFMPQLVAGVDGLVRMEFTMPDALTEWKFLGFAHDRELRAGLLVDKAVTAKDLMVEPNPPRFAREGDTIEFTVKVTNRTGARQAGKIRLTFSDAATMRPEDEALGNRLAEQAFDVPAMQSRSYSWPITVPDGMGFLTYKAVGATSLASDGEEGFLPVLSRRILVTESLPLPIRGRGTKQFEFTKLLESGKSATLRSQSLTVQMVSQPAWYAVMALPYLMEYPYECSEQVFNRLYANALARHIANSDPKIRRVFELWKGTPALDAPLERNQDLNSVMLEETPWLRQARDESQSRRNIGLLFDANRLDEESARVRDQIAGRQLSGGLWSWFPGGRPSEYISLYITAGFGRLRHLGAEVDVAPALKALDALDAWVDGKCREIQKSQKPQEYVPTCTDALYLYARSFFLGDHPVAAQNRDAVDFLLRQCRGHWVQMDSLQSQAQVAVALQRFGDKETPMGIMKSIKERSVDDGELGMSWRGLERSWWWYQAPIETQAMMIEAFDEVAHDAKAVEECKVWLLKQKQTQSWGTTKATADAIYGLLLRGDGMLGSDALVEVALGGQAIRPEKVEAGTGFYEQKFFRGEINPAMGRITLRKADDGVSWGSIHWQYLEDMGKVTPHEGTPLTLKKELFVKVTTKKGQELEPVTGPLSVGDELVVRIELRNDRDMEYVHLKDQRGSGTEPVNVLSGYRFQDGLAYYESTRDTASHFFIDYLPKGVHVFEYSTRVQLRGSYQTGIAEIQCMYAPEFNSHSESFTLEVK